MKELKWYKKCIGYFFPIVISHQKTDKHPKLKIKYFQGQWQLESADALYSDGHRYAPFRLAFDKLHKRNELFPIKHFLLLGAGLGSALHRIQKVYNHYPKSTLVEYDQDIVKLAERYFNINQNENVEFIHQEAKLFLENCNTTFDFIGIDLFEGLTNSELLVEQSFWKSISRISTNDVRIVVNSIFIKKNALLDFEEMIQTYFTFERLERKPNYIFILKKKKHG